MRDSTVAAGLGLYRTSTRTLVKLQSLLAAVAIIAGILPLLAALMQRWYHGAGSGRVVVDVLFWNVWIAFDAAKIVLVGVLVATIYRGFSLAARSFAALMAPPAEIFWLNPSPLPSPRKRKVADIQGGLAACRQQ